MVAYMRTKEQEYNEYVKKVTPTHNMWKNMFQAFLVGGIICSIGQFFVNFFQGNGLDKDVANGWTTLILIGGSILLTGLNLYSKIVKYGGAGALVPITGFANSVVAPAIEFKKEGQVFGVGSKIFTIAGPVILYGILSSWVLGVLSYLLQLMGIFWLS